MNKEYEILKREHEHYHGIEKGCILVKKRREMVGDRHYIEIFYCPVHNEECSRSGWMWGYFKGVANNKETEAIERLKKVT